MRRIQLLLVDDESDFLIAYARRLARRNVEVSTAPRARDAIEAIKAAHFDVVVMDVMMPGMSGIEALKTIKKIAPGLPVILLTGHANSEAALQGMAYGAFDYMLKPVGTDELYFKIQEAVRAGVAGVA
ncbi:response regulator [Pseudodesulfovibrio tunisiensis]|uniref:response regulator n=1 Tax=Pseudodesulfovibrio tunisiensis TaxID=463192 RepID=UPI001FB309CE|nr:response regulator [Pseudodesulfovibrio tunisiensis]